jgi:hypothetical protein
MSKTGPGLKEAWTEHAEAQKKEKRELSPKRTYLQS